MERKEYNGWTNYETWAVALWIDNEQGTQEAIRELVRNTIDGLNQDNTPRTDLTESDFKHLRVCAVADELKDWLEQMQEEELGNERVRWGLFNDLLNAALSEVDYFELARVYIRNYEEELKADFNKEPAN